jgi:hypothetical protein
MMTVVVGVIAVIIICAIPSAFLAWLLMLALGGLGYSVPFLPLWGIVFVATCLLSSARSS